MNGQTDKKEWEYKRYRILYLLHTYEYIDKYGIYNLYIHIIEIYNKHEYVLCIVTDHQIFPRLDNINRKLNISIGKLNINSIFAQFK